MAIKRLQLENFTVFENLDINLEPGMNVFIGENGLGKTHIMKLLYSATRAAKHDVSFSQKTVKVFVPDNSSIQSSEKKRYRWDNLCESCVGFFKYINALFYKNEKWNAEVINEENWEKQNANLESVFIPAKEILLTVFPSCNSLINLLN